MSLVNTNFYLESYLNFTFLSPENGWKILLFETSLLKIFFFSNINGLQYIKFIIEVIIYGK